MGTLFLFSVLLKIVYFIYGLPYLTSHQLWSGDRVDLTYRCVPEDKGLVQRHTAKKWWRQDRNLLPFTLTLHRSILAQPVVRVLTGHRDGVG